MQLDLSLVSRLAADSRSMMLWCSALKYELHKAETVNPDETVIKEAITNKLQSLESDLLAVATFISDVEAALNDPLILKDILEELKA